MIISKQKIRNLKNKIKYWWDKEFRVSKNYKTKKYLLYGEEQELKVNALKCVPIGTNLTLLE